MARRESTLVRRSLPEINTSLAVLSDSGGEEEEGQGDGLTQSYSDKATTWHETVKTEKSVHFATECGQHSEEESTPTSDRHLYSGNTFITESRTAAAESTDPSYDTNTFVALDSEDETRTASDISHTESLASSTVFSPAASSNDSSEYREWKDVTDIVKDIDELEESEFVTKCRSLFSDVDEEQATDFTESEDEEMAAIQREHFLMSTIRRLKLRDALSPRSLMTDVSSESSEPVRRPTHKQSQEEKHFCDQMIKKCLQPKIGRPHGKSDKEEKQTVKQVHRPLEYYGLSSAIVDRLRNSEGFHQKRCTDIDKETEKSLKFIAEHESMEADVMRLKFISETTARVQRTNMEDTIQAHLINMHPIKCFAEFVKGLPKFNENSEEILYKYKRKLESERDTG